MWFPKLLAISATATLALVGCSQQSDAPQGEEPKLDYFEQKNIAPDPKDNAQSQRKPEHAFARTALQCINKQYPNKISHVLTSADDVAQPVDLTPVFYGCFDWHSAVHGHWLLTRLWGQNAIPDMDAEILAALDANFTEEKIAGEMAYFTGKDRLGFERPYGLAWFLQLTAELQEISAGDGAKAEQAKIWLDRFKPLESLIVERLSDWVPKLAYPIRLGTHNQSAFAFGLFLDWAKINDNAEFAKLIGDKTLAFHRDDKNCPIGYEPSGEDFLSPCLMEADLMRRVMDQQEFAQWLTNFLPNIPEDGSSDWLKIGVVKDSSDGKLVHLDGVNLSRAWALLGIVSALPADDPRRASLVAVALEHGTAGEQSVSTPHYSGSHWLASFATYLRTARGVDAKLALEPQQDVAPTKVESNNTEPS
jgi:hypothetical protein